MAKLTPELLGADLLPHEFLLGVSQGQEFAEFYLKDGKYAARSWRPDMNTRIDAAKAAAPYFAARMQQVKHSGDAEAPIKIDVSDNEVARRVAFLLAKNQPAIEHIEEPPASEE